MPLFRGSGTTRGPLPSPDFQSIQQREKRETRKYLKPRWSQQDYVSISFPLLSLVPSMCQERVESEKYPAVFMDGTRTLGCRVDIVLFANCTNSGASNIGNLGQRS